MKERQFNRYSAILYVVIIGTLAFALYLVLPLVSGDSAGSIAVSAAQVAASPSPTASPTFTPTAAGDQNTTIQTARPEANGVGWVASKEPAPHWADLNLYAGTYQNQAYTSILQFNVGGIMPPGSKLTSAALELTGQNASNLGKTGEWQLELIDSSQTKDWAQASTTDILNTPALATIGEPIPASALGVSVVNRIEFNDEQTKLLEKQLEVGRLTFRIKGPADTADNLFSWVSGAGSPGDPSAPQLYLGGVPGKLTIITNTPTPVNVFTAAAYVRQATSQAEQFGTPTPMGLGVITATPGGERIEVTPVFPPENAATAGAISSYATAVAITTGTYTPTPKNWVVITATHTPVPPWTPTSTATPPFVPVARITAPPTPTRALIPDLLTLPLPSFLNGKVLAKTTRYGDQYAYRPIVLATDGSSQGILTGDLYYDAARTRELYSPDRQKLLYVAPGLTNDERLQVWVEDLRTGQKTQLTHVSRGIAYDPVWSPDGKSVAYVSGQTGNEEIYVYDLASDISYQLTTTALPNIYNQHPSWSPDGRQIVFKSNRDSGLFEIWIMNADGSDQRVFSRSGFIEIDPVWVKP